MFSADRSYPDTEAAGLSAFVLTNTLNEQQRRSDRIATCFSILVAVWLIVIIFPPVLDSPPRLDVQLLSLLWIVPLGLLFGGRYFVYPPILRYERTVRLWIILFLGIAMLSALASKEPLVSTGYLVVTVVGLLTAGGLWSCLKGRMPRCLSIYAELGTLIVTYVYFAVPLQHGRLSWNSSAPPNHLAVISFGILACSLAIRNRLLSYSCVAINLAVIVATQGRGSLAGALLTLGSYGLMVQLRQRDRGLALVKLFGAIGALVIALLLYENGIRATITDILLLNDRHRGLGSGFTGRVDAWKEAYGLFLDHPIVGIGFRMHERYMTSLSSAHSGYLSLLAEVGLLGVFSATGLTLAVLRRLMRLGMAGDRLAIIGFSFALGYFFIAIFERFFINFGNPTSLLVWMLLFIPDVPLRRVGPISGNSSYRSPA